MIKKIGSNKYGVVEYAISSVEDIADLPLGVAIGSTAVLINKDGIRTFALGEGEWVEYIDAERYDKNKLAQDLLFCGFGNDGEKHDDLDDRLIAEFDEINEGVNVGNYLVYNGYHIKADYSLEGLQRGVMLEGRTLQNVAPKTLTNTTKDSQGYFTSTAVEWDYLHRVSDNEPLLLKPDTEYTYIIEVVENTFNTYLYFPANEQCCFVGNEALILAKPLQTGVFVIKRKTKSVFDDSLLYDHYIACEKTAIESGTFKLRIICLEGDYTETQLEELPFIEGIKSTGDKSKNLFDGKTEEGQFETTGQPSSSSTYIRTVNFIKVKPNTKYVLSYRNSDTRLGVYEYDIDKNFVKVVFDGNPKYFTTSGTTQYLKFRVEKSTTDIQLEEGETPTPYQPYYEGYKISGKSCGKNIFEVKNKSTFNDKGVTIEYIGGNSYRINGTTTEQVIHAINTVDGSIKNNLYFKAGKKYIVSDGGNSSYATFMTQLAVINTVTNEALFPTTANGAITIFNNQDCIGRVVLVLRSGVKFDNVTMNIQIEESTTPTSYEPYKETTYSYILDEPLRSLPNGVCDTIDLETGVLTRRVGKVVLDGSEGWHGYNTTNESYNEAMVTLSFKCGNFYQHNSIVNNCPQTDAHRVVCVGEKGVYYRVPKSVSSDIESFKQWLQANPTTVLYELEEPTIHQLDQNRIYSFKDTTHVTSDNLIAPRITTNVLTNSNALISHLKGENLALTNEVSTLSLRNRETQETNETQDHIIDASLCAVDELYMMYETTQEVEAMSTDEEGSRMVDMYVAMVQRGLKTIDQVPVRYRERVREILAQLED